MNGWQWLTLIGGCLQFGSVVLVVCDARRTLQKVTTDLRRPVVISGVTLNAPALFGAGGVVGGREATEEEIVQRLEREVSVLRQSVESLEKTARREIEQLVGEAERRVGDALTERASSIEKALRGLAKGRLRWLEATLALTGIVLVTLGAVFG